MTMRGRLVSLVAALALGASGCGRRAGSTAGDVTLRFWAFGREGEVVAALMDDFERSHPGVRVEVQQIPWRAAHEKLLTAYVGETLPDVAQLGNTWIGEFAALGALQPLDSLVAQSTIVTPTAFFPGLWATNVVEGRVLGVPWYADTRVLFYRADLLAKAGVRAPPTTWVEWVDAMRRIRALSSGKDYAIFLPANEWFQPVILAQQTGSTLLTADGTRGAFRDAAFRRAFHFYISLFRDSLAPTVGTQQIANLYQEFARGSFAMYITGPWNLGEFANRLPPALQGAWATSQLPGPDGDSSRLSMAGGSSLVLVAGSPHPREAWQLMEFLSQPAQQAAFYRLSGDLPPVIAAWSDSSLAGDARARAFRDQLQHVRPLPAVPEWEQVATKVQEYAEAVIRRAMTEAQALAALDHDVDLILEKRRWMMQRAATAGGR